MPYIQVSIRCTNLREVKPYGHRLTFSKVLDHQRLTLADARISIKDTCSKYKVLNWSCGGESQEPASNSLDTLNVFGRRLSFENASSTNITLQKPNFQVHVQDITPEMQHTYSLNLASYGSLADIQDSPMDTPLEGATTSLTSELLHPLSSMHSTDILRIFNVLLQSDAFFVTAQPKD